MPLNKRTEMGLIATVLILAVLAFYMGYLYANNQEASAYDLQAKADALALQDTNASVDPVTHERFDSCMDANHYQNGLSDMTSSCECIAKTTNDQVASCLVSLDPVLQGQVIWPAP